MYRERVGSGILNSRKCRRIIPGIKIRVTFHGGAAGAWVRRAFAQGEAYVSAEPERAWTGLSKVCYGHFCART